MCARVWVNFKELRAKLRFEDVLRHFGVEVRRKGNQHQGPCPLPNHQGRPGALCFSANLERGIYQCFGCGSAGNLLDFACRMAGNDPKDGDALRAVAVELQQKFLSGPMETAKESERGRSAGTELPVKTNIPLDFRLKDLDAGHPYLVGRKFAPDTLHHFGAGFCSRGLVKGRIAIPLLDDAGRLLGYVGRVADDSTISDENPKYRFPSRREVGGVVYELNPALFLYNGHRFTKPSDDLIVVPGFSAVWWLTQCGVPDVVSTMGLDCSDEQAELLVRKVSSRGRLWLLPTGDRSGDKFAALLLEKLSPHRFMRWLRLPKGDRPTGLSRERLKSMLA